MSGQINTIREKIKQLKKLDKNFTLFGSQKHRYRVNPTILLAQVQEFETTHHVTLPPEYVEFITVIGNGGVGPFYGLEPLENGLFDDLDYKRPDSLLNPGKPFLYTEPWNAEFAETNNAEENEQMYEEEYAKFQEQYFDNEYMNGVIAICNYGCGVSLNLVVNGPEYGNIWTDDRGSDGGIYPSCEQGNKDKISFLNWYELWLDNSIREVQRNFLQESEETEKEQKSNLRQKPWWKIW